MYKHKKYRNIHIRWVILATEDQPYPIRMPHSKWQIFVFGGTLLAFALCISSCQTEDSVFDYSSLPAPTGELYLKEYYQDSSLLYSFSYQNNERLRQVSFHQSRKINYEVVYNDTTGRPAAMVAQYSKYVLRMEFQFDSSRLEAYRFTVNGQEAFEIDLVYDSLGLVVKAIESSDHRQGPVVREFEWLNGNVVKSTAYSLAGDADFVPSAYVYSYDTKKNPFATVYKSIGYNVVENFPLSAGNWTELKGYELGQSHPAFTVKNKFTYYGLDYPYQRISEGESDHYGKERPVTTTFVY